MDIFSQPGTTSAGGTSCVIMFAEFTDRMVCWAGNTRYDDLHVNGALLAYNVGFTDWSVTAMSQIQLYNTGAGAPDR